MAYSIDPEIGACLAARAETLGLDAVQQPQNVFELRESINETMLATLAAVPDAPDVEMAAYAVGREDGGVVPLNLYSRRGAERGPVVIYVHGGGMICGSATHYQRLVRHYVQLTGVSFLAVDYRLAPEHSADGLAQDVFAALQWLHGQAVALQVDSDRVAVMGDSGGGGVAAAMAILARDAGVALARQILVYPMLDDRNITPDPLLVPYALWSYDANRMAWAAVLANGSGPPDVSPTIAPARLGNFAGLAPAYIEVGELDIFRNESVDYAARLLAAGVSCELHVYAGAPHAFDQLCPDAALTHRALAERLRAIRLL